MSKVSVVVVAYRRLDTLEEVLKGWLAQCDDVWLADSSDKFTTELPIHHVKFSPDPGNVTRHAVALLTTGEYVIKADDDVVPSTGLADVLVEGCKRHPDSIVGIHGRTFRGENYYGDTVCYSARTTNADTKVDFVGIITCTPRKYLAFDLTGCTSPIEDVFWQMGAFPCVGKYVIPTNEYTQLPTSEDNQSLFHTSDARTERATYCREWYWRMHK